ncbi:MAG TPA: hypothetical protein VGC77_05320 [Rhodopseudomonas sp.]|uniref:hypothetical protein n=1 Tax=Rhodopseudomonas sp. TaxID=1078 RepID=UPI002EDB9FFC
MPYALFCDDAKVSKTYPTEANVWKHAKESGLVIDVEPKDNMPTPRRVLDAGYEIRACEPDPGENIELNEREARDEGDFQLPSRPQKVDPALSE